MCDWCKNKWKEIDEFDLDGIWNCPDCKAELEWGT